MIRHSFGEAYRLIGRSGKEAAIYLAVSVFCAGLYAFLAGDIGLGDAYSDLTGFRASPLKNLLAYLPGIVIAVWFSTGLSGRMTMDAFNGEPAPMTGYANSWFVKNLLGTMFVTLLMWGPSFLLLAGGGLGLKVPAALLALAWLIAAAWFSLRISLWLNSSFIEGQGLVEAMKRSYSATNDKVLALLFIAVVPMLCVKSVSWVLGKLLPGQAAVVYYLNSLLEGLGMIVVMGAFAAAFVRIKKAEAAPESSPAS